MSHYGEIFDDACRRLRKALPLSVPVRVRTCQRIVDRKTGELHTSDYKAYYRDERLVYFTIRIVRDQSEDSAVDCLIHEYAHCVHHELNPTAKRAHTKQWGEIHAKVYEAYHGKH